MSAQYTIGALDGRSISDSARAYSFQGSVMPELVDRDTDLPKPTCKECGGLGVILAQVGWDNWSNSPAEDEIVCPCVGGIDEREDWDL